MERRLVEDEAYGCLAHLVSLNVCKRSVPIPMSPVACVEGQQGACQYYIDLIVRHKGTVKGFSSYDCRVQRKNGILNIATTSPKLCSAGHGNRPQLTSASN